VGERVEAGQSRPKERERGKRRAERERESWAYRPEGEKGDVLLFILFSFI
jgi:hypothetical protein